MSFLQSIITSLWAHSFAYAAKMGHKHCGTFIWQEQRSYRQSW